jgi:hypothetical protein
MLIATRLTGDELTTLTRALGILNLVALAGGFYVYQYGVEALYPLNAVTQIIYLSKDVAGYEYYRVPSTFLSAAAYGGTMLYTLPYLIGQLFGSRVNPADRVLSAAGVVAAGAGILLCAARMPVVMFAAASLVALICSRLNAKVALFAVGLAATGLLIAQTDERLQRAATLEDTEMVSDRIRSSANESFIDLLVSYPLGAGMGSSAGTSVPYFLADRAPKQIGLENEFSRILIDQGWFGLACWLVFLFWLFRSPPDTRLAGSRWGLGVMLMYSLCMPTWATGFIGSGNLSAVPQSVLLLTQMGILSRFREYADQTKTQSHDEGSR